MKHLFIFLLLVQISVSSTAQTIQSIFDWSSNTEILTKDEFRPLFFKSYPVSPSDPKCKIYTLNSYGVQNQKGDTYTIELHSVCNFDPNRDSYDGFSIVHQGKSIFTYYSYDPLYNTENITTDKSKAYFLQIPLDEKSFALCFGGCLYGYDNAPELVIVVVSGNQAKVVFDNYAYAYKYIPAPNFLMEFIDNVDGIFEQEDPTITPTHLQKRTKHKIWKEGNVLKYKSWK